MTKTISIILICFIFKTAFGQNDTLIKNESFPKTWTKGDWGRGKILAWVEKKDDRPFDYRSCILFMQGADSAGKLKYFISEYYTNEKPFTKWYISTIHISPRRGRADTTFTLGYWDTHLKTFNHKPTEIEIYDLLTKWNFKFYEQGWQTISAGADDKLWLKELGFILNKTWTKKYGD